MVLKVNFYENRGKDGMVRIDAARPVIQQLKALHEVISLFCPSSDAISGLVWGSFTCILEVSLMPRKLRCRTDNHQTVGSPLLVRPR